MAKDFDYYFAQLRRTEDHRSKSAEVEIRRMYKRLLKETKQFVSEEYYKLAEDGKLTFEILRSKGRDARLMEEVEQRLNTIAPKVAEEIKKTVEEIYTLAYNGMVDAVKKSKTTEELEQMLHGLRGVTPETIREVMQNQVMQIALEKNHKEIIWNIRRVIAVGLATGDRFETMAKRLAGSLDGDYKKAIRIIRTETGRVREAGHLASSKEINEALKNGETNLRMAKTWKTMKDGAVREQHEPMNGITVAMDEEFTLPDGTKTQAPKQSGVASQDINCRCFVKYSLMSPEQFSKAAGRAYPESTPGFDREKAAKLMEPAMQGLTKEQREQFLNKVEKGRAEERDLLLQNMDKFGYETITAPNGAAWYSPSTGKITINMAEQPHDQRGAYKTIFHESGHWIDHLYTKGGTTRRGVPLFLSNSVKGKKGFHAMLKKDSEAWIENLRKTVKPEPGRNMLWLAAYNELKGPLNASMSDLMKGLTLKGEALTGDYGHANNYYTVTNIECEAFAHFFEANMSGGKKRERLYAMFPEAGKWYDEIIKSITGGK